MRAVIHTAAILALGLLMIPGHGQSLPAPGDALAARGDTPQNQTRSTTLVTDPAAADAELPGAIYKDAMHPLDVVRQSLENWSDSELAALSIGMRMAREACDKMKPEDYSKDDLYDMAHLCAFGQDWDPATAAALRYLASRAPEHRTQAFAICVGAYVHLGANDLAVTTTRQMLQVQPYDAEVAYAVRYMKDS